MTIKEVGLKPHTLKRNEHGIFVLNICCIGSQENVNVFCHVPCQNGEYVFRVKI